MRMRVLILVLSGLGARNSDGQTWTTIEMSGSGSAGPPFAVNDLAIAVGQGAFPPSNAGAYRTLFGIIDPWLQWFGADGIPYDVNRYGDIVGTGRLSGMLGERAFHYDFQRSRVTDLGTLGGTGSSALAINDLGDVVGWAHSWNGQSYPVLWRGDSVTNLMPDLPWDEFAEARDINELGQIVGLHVLSGSIYRGFLIDGEQYRVVDAPDYSELIPLAINNRGQVLCHTRNPITSLIWQDGDVVILPSPPNAQSCIYSDLSDDGTVVGTCYVPGSQDPDRAVAIIEGVFHDFTPTGARDVEFRAISPSGVMAGAYLPADSANWRVFMLSRVGDMNWDGRVDNFDIDAFVLGLSDPNAYRLIYGWTPNVHGDANQDGALNNFDIDVFVSLIAGG